MPIKKSVIYKEIGSLVEDIARFAPDEDDVLSSKRVGKVWRKLKEHNFRIIPGGKLAGTADDGSMYALSNECTMNSPYGVVFHPKYEGMGKRKRLTHWEMEYFALRQQLEYDDEVDENDDESDLMATRDPEDIAREHVRGLLGAFRAMGKDLHGLTITRNPDGEPVGIKFQSIEEGELILYK